MLFATDFARSLSAHSSQLTDASTRITQQQCLCLVARMKLPPARLDTHRCHFFHEYFGSQATTSAQTCVHSQSQSLSTHLCPTRLTGSTMIQSTI